MIFFKLFGCVFEYIVDIIGFIVRLICDILIKIYGVFEYISELIDCVCVLIRDIFIEWFGVVKYIFVISDFGDVLSVDVRVGEWICVFEYVLYCYLYIWCCVYGLFV